jgi:hypothetical protein
MHTIITLPCCTTIINIELVHLVQWYGYAFWNFGQKLYLMNYLVHLYRRVFRKKISIHLNSQPGCQTVKLETAAPHSSFLLTAAFPAQQLSLHSQPASHSPNKQAQDALDIDLRFDRWRFWIRALNLSRFVCTKRMYTCLSFINLYSPPI